MSVQHTIENGLLEVLGSAQTEREIQPYLKAYPLLIRNAFNAWAWNYSAVIPEFWLGSDYRLDYLVLGADSGCWHASIVEFKSHKERPFNNQGIQSKPLNIALTQIQDRITWINANQKYFRQSLSDYFSQHDVAAQCSNAADHVKATTEIVDLRTPIKYKYTIVIGRRDMISKDQQVRRHMASIEPVQITTYDRLVDVAKKLDGANCL